VFENRQSTGDPIPVNLRTRIFVLGGETTTSLDGEPEGTGTLMNDVWTSRNMGESPLLYTRGVFAEGGFPWWGWGDGG
jgi:hypothetical protein